MVKNLISGIVLGALVVGFYQTYFNFNAMEHQCSIDMAKNPNLVCD